ncbi:YifB family Mg chelatase-like AAA ATPase [Neptuniibacter sp. CAU 1671]|uniref:YifB family Mg chelatase-like AAA ATPase n=1 Tax=Neptuniibacter sp. CAU 1671 TaxID=3032593 RepID=UPI0023DB56A7|nr:YifB family Mg chelatase-like AAA ATPase [Neptuniibacter sp. CAU 1671]MDF2182523.1 YifB family Mg chelatase-like AAA ATPase [Neptuniibacter sp. CAU 1671]
MSLATIHTRALVGISAPPVTVEVHLSGGLPSFAIVGLPETAVKESRERVRSALLNAGFEFPQRRLTVNLAPADLPKEGGRYDLAIAIGILVASGQLNAPEIDQYEFLGELALSGELRPIEGVIPAALSCQTAARKLILPVTGAEQAGLVRELTAHAADHLLKVCAHLVSEQLLPLVSPLERASFEQVLPDLADVKGQIQAKRALELAAAGGHNLLFSGAPGSGKSMLAQRLTGLMPPLTEKEQIEVAAVHSVAGRAEQVQLHYQRPFRAPHHTASAVALVGGGSLPRPGEISLAHHGVLFLDELPEFSRSVLEVLREPLEAGEIVISRAARQAAFPAQFQLVAAMNPCPCGYFADGSGRCQCGSDQVRRYQSRLSGPLLDRIDLQLSVRALPKEDLLSDAPAHEPTAVVRERVIQARQLQLARQGCANRQLSGRMLEQHCQLSREDQLMLAGALETLGLSARAYHRILRVARTIADLAQREKIMEADLLEALSYRSGLKSSL